MKASHVTGDGVWRSSAAELRGSLSMLLAARQPHLASGVIDSQIVAFAVVAEQLPNASTAIRVALAERTRLDQPLAADATDADHLDHTFAWMRYRALMAVAELARIQLHADLKAAELASWLRGAS